MTARAPTGAELQACFAILPFRFLEPPLREMLAAELTVHELPAGHRVLAQDDEGDERVWLLLSGRVEVVDHHRGPDPRRVGTIDGGHYFGERRALFDQPRAYEIRTLEPSVGATFPGERLRWLLAESRTFALTLGQLLRDKQGLLRDFERFVAEVRLGAARGYLVIPRLLHRYRPLRPALHRGANRSEIDFDCLRYVVPRLPEGISEVLSLFLTDELTPSTPAPEVAFEPIPTAARRRTAWRMMPGKVVILLRDGWTDLVDLVTCLCAYSVEARKLRQRLKDPALVARLLNGELDELPFDEAERAHLEALWPGRVAETLATLVTHHEDFAVHVFHTTNNYNAAKGERWTSQIADAAHRLLGVEPHELPEDFEVHVVSSNTHSVTNTLSPWMVQQQQAIEGWGRRAHPEWFDQSWPDPMDRVVALSRPYLAAHPEQRARKRLLDEAVGVARLRETAFTGIEVELFCLQRLLDREWDPAVPRPDGRPGLLVNIDYAFGQQADPILTSLLALFGTRVRTVSILGKAGGLEGRRGDVLVATSFIEQETDALIAPPTVADAAALAARLPDRAVRTGRAATVGGTLLQNEVLLHYYRHVWQCLGLEMEGIWYAKRLVEGRRLGLVRPECEARFLYYISDLPLAHGESLAGPMKAHEGIPPLYAITRQVLTRVFTGRAAG